MKFWTLSFDSEMIQNETIFIFDHLIALHF
jgi:hypothetical protein